MLLELKREWLTQSATMGELFVDGIKQCFSLELPVKDGLPYSAIPPTSVGSYIIRLLPSPKFQRSIDPWIKQYADRIPHVFGIPNRSDILIHFGNSPEDTNGCIL